MYEQEIEIEKIYKKLLKLNITSKTISKKKTNQIYVSGKNSKMLNKKKNI